MYLVVFASAVGFGAGSVATSGVSSAAGWCVGILSKYFILF